MSLKCPACKEGDVEIREKNFFCGHYAQNEIIRLMSASTHNYFSTSSLGPGYILAVFSNTEVEHVEGPFLREEYQMLIDTGQLVKSKKWPEFFTLFTFDMN